MESILDFIEYTLKKVQEYLDEESIEAVSHYLSHNELEMAFEGLFLEIMSLDTPLEFNWDQCRQIGEKLNLHEETVFDFEFWPKFEAFIASRVG